MRIPVNGVKWNVTVTGSGSPLLLLHGFTGAGSNWEPFVPSWRDAFRLLIVDIIGHGLSDSPEDPARYAMERAAADLAGILDHVGIAKTDVLGYSMGGRLALMFAVRYPERVGRLILESSSPGLADPGDRQARVQRDEQLAEQIERRGFKSLFTIGKTSRCLPHSAHSLLPFGNACACSVCGTMPWASPTVCGAWERARSRRCGESWRSCLYLLCLFAGKKTASFAALEKKCTPDCLVQNSGLSREPGTLSMSNSRPFLVQ